ncbi:threonine-phosphate decarboxylase CobD [Uliginosibacterium sp. 31-16]|uniref:threonine-phosphate decarboxylase CobD n=1 Tax=Uliginosibacterium sp. 31-16 TaxID=3068315 RepID=UPI00273EE3C4|nr:threonine-phosphate decarboxylase CobD [Uliginosibacterium sp. 31-16]MDP5239161.1 threonine-phosphate decarboxylase CobD [Uliginosibacterium sp. 31-16]
MSTSSSLQHGGRLRAAAHDFRIPLQRWLDLSTGINPRGWPVPSLPAEVWRRLPEDDDGLAMASLACFGGHRVLPLAGSQAAIQILPQLFSPRRVGILSPCYAEHLKAWVGAGHPVESVAYEDAEQAVERLDVLLLTNPNNPTGRLVPPATLRAWHSRLATRGGLLVVDEAFIDASPELSVLGDANQPGLVVLRSLGKFWGLAGIRCGFIAAKDHVLDQLNERLGPWTVSGPARWVAQRALADRAWRETTANSLHAASARLAALLAAHGLPSPSGCALFRWVPTPLAHELFIAFAKRAVLTREHDGGLRIGLPGAEEEWEKFEAVLAEVMA